MDIKPSTNPEQPHTYAVSFTPDETKVISAAYAEEVHERASKGNSSDEFDTSMAGWDSQKSCTINIETGSVTSLDAVLKRFQERTLDIVATLPETTRVPAFRNKDIGLRQSLGKAAAQLAEELTKRLFAIETNAEIRGLPETKGRSYNR